MTVQTLQTLETLKTVADRFLACCDACIRVGLSKLSDDAVMAIFLLLTAIVPLTAYSSYYGELNDARVVAQTAAKAESYRADKGEAQSFSLVAYSNAASAEKAVCHG